MKYHLSLLITAHLLIVVPSCHAMENKLNSAEQKTITTNLEQPQSVLCFPNNIVAIAGKIGALNYGCSLYDFSTNKAIMSLSANNNDSLHIAAHPNKKLLAIRTTKENNIKQVIIYDITTKEKIWEKTSNYFRGAPALNSIDDTILIGNDFGNIDSFNYKTDLHTSYPLGTHLNGNPGFHPTKQECILLTLDFAQLAIQEVNKNSFETKKFDSTMIIKDGKYSPDGSLIAILCNMGDMITHNIYTLDPVSGLYSYIDMPDDTKKSFCSIAFHPSSFILTALSYSGKYISYFNTKTGQLISTTPIFSNNDYLYLAYTKRIDFSCDGTKLIVALTDKCIVLEVPFEALYKPGTKDKCIFSLWALQHRYGNENMLPQDIRCELIKYLLASSKYSLTNY